VNAGGQTVERLEEKAANGAVNLKIDASRLAPGLYTLLLNGSKGCLTRKFIKE
jgi:hypothetical protein